LGGGGGGGGGGVFEKGRVEKRLKRLDARERKPNAEPSTREREKEIASSPVPVIFREKKKNGPVGRGAEREKKPR